MSYWDSLAAAAERLQERDFWGAERAYARAMTERENSPARVFLTEKVADALGRLWGNLSGRAEGGDRSAGRWSEAAGEFRRRFRTAAAETVRQAERLCDLALPIGSPADQAIVASGLFLLCRSDLHPEDLSAAVPLLKSACETVARGGRPLPVELIRPDLPLSEEDRLWLVRRCEEFLAGPQTRSEDGYPDAATRTAWARALSRLLSPCYFGTASELREERHWLQARLADDYLDDPQTAVNLYRAFSEVFPAAGPRLHQAQARQLELLANVSHQHFPVPRYDEARAVLNSCSPAVTEQNNPVAVLLPVLDWRRPRQARNLAWASAATEPSGLITVILWWRDQPRDVAFWTRGDDDTHLRSFLAPCADRLLAADPRSAASLASMAGTERGVWSVAPFSEALLEPYLPPEGLTAEAAHRWAMSEAAPWRNGWVTGRGHPMLSPGHGPDAMARGPGGPVTAALEAGLLWLACLSRVRRADASLRGGLQEMAERGDPASGFCQSFLQLWPEQIGAPVPSQEPWILPPLRIRPDPLTEMQATGGPSPRRSAAHPDLSGNDVAVVCTGQPEAILSAWTAGARAWRLVLDRTSRLPSIAGVIERAGGLVTFMPAQGRVHCLRDALDLLESLIAGENPPDRGEASLLPLLHWIRLVESHNGDLLDCEVVRPRAAGALPLWDRYRELVADLPRATGAAPDGPASSAADRWAREYAARAASSRVVIGPVGLLLGEPQELAALWGLTEDSEISWVFLDSAAVHWRLWRELGEGVRDLQAQLARRGRRHLSLLSAGAFLREDLEAILADWLASFGTPYYLSLTDVRPPVLHLALGGISPDAHVLAQSAISGQLRHLQDLQLNDEQPLVLLPETGRSAPLWAELACRSGTDQAACLPLHVTAEEFWSRDRLRTAGRIERLVVPVLASLGCQVVRAAGDEEADWQRADAQRRQMLACERRLCSLEVNALLASGAACVDIADPRWWRRFSLAPVGTIQLAAHQKSWIDHLLGQCDGHSYDLPLLPAGPGSERAGGPSRDVAEPWQPVISRWLQERDRVDASGRGRSPASDPGADAAFTVGATGAPARLHLGGGAQAWSATATWLAERRERGDLNAWVLCVTDQPPPGAADLVAEYPASGPSLPLREPSAGERGVDQDWPGSALIWMPPEAWAGPGLPRWLTEQAPAILFGGDLRTWLPAAEDPALVRAGMLRHIVGSVAGRVEVFATCLTPTWERFFRDFWADQFGERGQVIDASAAAAARKDQPRPEETIGVSRLAPVPCACRACGARVLERAEPATCPECGLDLMRWRGEWELEDRRRALLRQKLQAVQKRVDLGGARPLEIRLASADWLMAEDVLRELNIPFERGGAGICATVAVDRTWRLTASASVAGAAQAVAWLYPPASSQELMAGKGVARSLWYLGEELVAEQWPRPAARAHRLPRLLRSLDAWRPAANVTAAWAEEGPELWPLSYLSELLGMPAAEVVSDLHLWQWLQVLTGEAAASAAPQISSDRRPVLTGRMPFVEIEYRAGQLAGELDVLLPMLLASARPGVVTHWDLAALPVRIAPQTLAWLDRFLLASSLRLTGPLPGAVTDEGEMRAAEELLYQPVCGLLVSSRRAVAYLGSPQGVTARLHHHLDLFLSEVKALLETAETHEEGYRIRPAIECGSFLDESVIELGCTLGLWRWTGEPGTRAVAWPALASLARAAAHVPAEMAIALVRELAGERASWQGKLRSALSVGLLEDADLSSPAPPAAVPPERTGAAALPAPVHEAAARVAALCTRGTPGQLVIQGLSGSGKMAALSGGLRSAFAAGMGPEEMIVFCPDVATAAEAHEALRGVRRTRQPTVRLIEEAVLPSGQMSDAAAQIRPEGELTIMLQAQRIPADARYRIAQHGRQGVLLITVDPGEVGEPWEHLFLSTPRAEEIVVLEDQLRLARRIWSEVRVLGTPSGKPRGKSRRKPKGICRARWAGNLDECLASIQQEAADWDPGERMTLVAPAGEDLQYLGRCMGAEGWIPAFAQELDALLLPGPLEFLAALHDAYPAGSSQIGEHAGAGVDAAVADATEAEWLAAFLPSRLRRAYANWRRHGAGLDERSTIADFYERSCRTVWAAGFLSDRVARQRVEDILSGVADETLARFARRPLVEAWRREVGRWLDRPQKVSSGPVLTLATPDVAGGRISRAAVYLCLGSEERRQHYRVMSRVSDRVLVLYQERSPLPSDIARDAS